MRNGRRQAGEASSSLGGELDQERHGADPDHKEHKELDREPDAPECSTHRANRMEHGPAESDEDEDYENGEFNHQILHLIPSIDAPAIEW